MRAVESPQCVTAKKQDNKRADFPIVALEMLTQRVPQIHCDYLQPHTTVSFSYSLFDLGLRDSPYSREATFSEIANKIFDTSVREIRRNFDFLQQILIKFIIKYSPMF